MPSHYEDSLQHDIDRIRKKISEMARLAESALEACLKLLASRDRQLAYAVILRDRRIDELEKEVDRLCLEFLIRQQPVARHLRFERVSDQATNISEEVIYMVTGEYPRKLGGETWRMVFIDDRNRCRSQMAEAIGNSMNRPQFVFASAGVTPTEIDPGTVEFMKT